MTFSITLAIAVEVIAGIVIVAAALRTTGEHGESSTNHAVAMGLTYGIGTAIAYPVTGAALNPARATGIAIFAQNQGLNEEPLQQLWVFWICPVLAAAVVALIVIVSGMVSTKKNTPDAEVADEIENDTALDEASVSDGNDGEENEQSSAQTYTHEGVESN